MSARFLLFTWLLLPLMLHAGVFKCVSPAGQHSYQDHPCPADHVSHVLKSGYFSQISREPYQVHALKQQQQQQARQEAAQQQRQDKAGQWQQRPEVRGGAIIKREWWQDYPTTGKVPSCEYVVVSVDPAYTEKEENDPSGCVTVSVFLSGPTMSSTLNTMHASPAMAAPYASQPADRPIASQTK